MASLFMHIDVDGGENHQLSGSVMLVYGPRYFEDPLLIAPWHHSSLISVTGQDE